MFHSQVDELLRQTTVAVRAHYGDIDFVPTEQYDVAVARQAIDDAQFVVETAGVLIIDPAV